MPEHDDLDPAVVAAVRQRVGRYVPTQAPALSALAARRRRRLVGRAAGGAAVTVVALVGASAAWPTGASSLPQSRPAAVPADLTDPGAGPLVVPEEVPAGYTYEGTTSAVSQGVVDTRSVLLRPPRLVSAPTIQLCADASREQDRCGDPPLSVRRTVDGIGVTITLRGEGAALLLPQWQTRPLTTDLSRSDLFRQRDVNEGCASVVVEGELLLLDDDRASERRARRVAEAVDSEEGTMSAEQRTAADDLARVVTAAVTGELQPEERSAVEARLGVLRRACAER